MKLGRTLGALAVATALSTSAAYAADVTMNYSSPGFDWDGFYAGVGIAGSVYNTGVTIGQVELEGGVNLTSGDFLFGGELYVGWGRNSLAVGTGIIGGEVRAGYLVDPEVLLYVAGGGEYLTNGAVTLGTVGGGVEFAATDDLSIDVEYKFKWTGGINGHEVGASLLWHF